MLFNHQKINKTNLSIHFISSVFLKTSIIKNIAIKEKRFGFEPEITAKISKLDIKIFEVGISYNGRKYSEGKKINWKDGFRAIYCIIRYKNIFKSIFWIIGGKLRGKLND